MSDALGTLGGLLTLAALVAIGYVLVFGSPFESKPLPPGLGAYMDRVCGAEAPAYEFRGPNPSANFVECRERAADRLLAGNRREAGGGTDQQPVEEADQNPAGATVVFGSGSDATPTQALVIPAS